MHSVHMAGLRPRQPNLHHEIVVVDMIIQSWQLPRMTKMTLASTAYRFLRPRELEHLTGLTPGAIRDWRRRKLIHESYEKEGTGFHPVTIAAFLFLKQMSDHGIGPKQFFGWEAGFATLILRHAMADASMWETDEAWNVYQDEQTKHSLPLTQYLVIRTPPDGYAHVNRIGDAFRGDRNVQTIVDLEALGLHLRERLGRPIGFIEETVVKVV